MCGQIGFLPPEHQRGSIKGCVKSKLPIEYDTFHFHITKYKLIILCFTVITFLTHTILVYIDISHKNTILVYIDITTKYVSL